MSRRPPTPQEVAATFHFHDRYAAQRDGAIEFYATLEPHEHLFIERLVTAVVLALYWPDATVPRCPKRCDAGAEPLDRPGRYACVGCGTEFDWPPIGELAETARQAITKKIRKRERLAEQEADQTGRARDIYVCEAAVLRDVLALLRHGP